MVSEKEYLRNNLYDLFSQLIEDRSSNDPKGYPLIYERQNGIRPNGTFFSIEFRDTIQLGTPKFSKAIWNSQVNDYEQTSVVQIRRNMSLRGFTDLGSRMIEDFQHSLKLDKYVDEFKKRGLVINVGDILESSQEIDAKTEIFSVLDFDITYTRRYTESIGWIETVDIKHEFI